MSETPAIESLRQIIRAFHAEGYEVKAAKLTDTVRGGRLKSSTSVEVIKSQDDLKIIGQGASA